MIKKVSDQLKDSEGGFTLVEMAMMIFIAAIIMVPMYTIMMQVSQLGPTDRRFDIIRAALAEHVRVYGYYPCPASLSASPGDPLYFEGNAAGSGCPGAITTAGAPANRVSIGAVPVEPLSLVMGCNKTTNANLLDIETYAVLRDQLVSVKNRLRNNDYEKGELDRNGDGTVDADEYNQGRLNNRLQKEDCITYDHLLDEYGSKIVYAVTISQTNPATVDLANPDTGKITLKSSGAADFSNQPDFIILSVGQDRKGAYNENGAISGIACNSVPSAKDVENCDYTLPGAADARFRIMPKSLAQNNNYYDDYIDFSLDGAISENDFWYNMSNTDNLMFNPKGRVLIDNIATDGSGTAKAADTDKLVINRGNMKSNNLSTKGSIRAGEDINASGVVTGTKAVRASKFCYVTTPSTPCN
tara:strand:- start:56 stop:1297 length:1242 start_codon:yes stop_codon:yes gene_type:complete